MKLFFKYVGVSEAIEIDATREEKYRAEKNFCVQIGNNLKIIK